MQAQQDKDNDAIMGSAGPDCCSNRMAATWHQCPHLSGYKEGGGLAIFRTIQQYLHTCRFGLVPSEKLPRPKCHMCEKEGKGREYCLRLHVCMQCVFIGCWNTLNTKQNHVKQHFGEGGHILAVDVELAQIYCAQCEDYVYDPDFDAVVASERNKALGILQELTAPDSKRTPYVEWKPSAEETESLKLHTKPHSVPPHLLGLRGLQNLGNTCFMNCILQSFIHNPLMRNYFLADMHNRHFCSYLNDKSTGICLGCEMDLLFEQIFKGDRTPYTPSHFLYSVWKYADHFAGYEQQDAHEFLITALDGIHTHCRGKAENCDCIVHKIFGGSLRSDLTCLTCGFTSAAIDPFFDISLDLPKSTHFNKTRKRPDALEDDDDISREDDNTIYSCLKRFTLPERLGGKEQFRCSNCNNTYQESTKQLSVLSLPIVICFHLKRFKQGNNASDNSKIDTFIQFPARLDLAPYLSSTLLSKKNGTVHTPKPEMYSLFAMVDHHGELNNGHFTCYVKHQDEWFKCDDAWITRSSLSHVRKSKGSYLLFYIRESLEYQRGVAPTAGCDSPEGS